MAQEKVFSIKIDGLEQSIKSAETLYDALMKLQGAVDGKATATGKLTAEQKAQQKVENEIAQTAAKYNSIMSEEGAEMAKLKMEITAKNKELKQEIELEKANETVQNGTLNTYRDKQNMLVALGKIIRTTNAQTEEEVKRLEDMKAQYKALNDELTEFDREMGVSARLVGKYNQEAAQPIVAQLKEMQREMANMLANGVQPTDEKFQELAQRAGKLKDAINDANMIVGKFASDTKGIDTFVQGTKDAVSVMGLYNGVMSTFGLESEKAEEAMKKLVAIQTTLNSLQQIQASLLNQTSLLYKAKTSILGLFTKAQNGATIATKAFGVALKSIGIGLILSALAYLVEYFDDIKEWVGEMTGGTEKLSKGWEKFMSVLKGVGSAITNWVINPMRTAIEVGKKLIDLDFSGAWDELGKGAKRQFDVVGNFTKAYNKSQAKYAEERTRKQAAENAKQLKQQIDTNEARYGSDHKYTTEGKKLWDGYYKALIASTKKGTEERTKAENEYYKFQRETAKKEEELRKQQIERAKKYAEEFDKAWKTYQQETAKMSDDNVKRMLENDKKALDDGKANTEESLKERRRQWKVYYASLDSIAEEEAEKSKTEAQKSFDELVKAAKAAGKNVKKLQEDLADRLFEIDQKLGQQLVQNQEALKAQLEQDQKELVKSQIESVEKMVSEGQASLKSRLETISTLNGIKNPTISMLRDMKAQYEAYLDDLEAEHKRFVDMIEAEMSSLNPDSDEYAKLVKKKEQVDKEYLTQRKAVSSKIADLDKNVTDKILSDVETYKTAVEEIMSGMNEMLSDSTDRLSDELDAVGEKYDAIHEKVEQGQERIQSLNEQLAEAQGAQRLALQEQLAEESAANEERMAQEAKYAAQKKALEQKMADAEYKSKRAELVASLVQAVANTALAVTKAVSQNPMLGGLPGSAIATATGAIQIALISKQLASLKPVKLERGGYIDGPRHSQGGIRIPGTNTEIEGGEFVVNRRASARYRGLLEELNRYGNTGIRRPNYYANGGEISLPTDNSSQMVLDAIKGININPVVSVVDISRAQSNLTRVRQYARG